MPMNLLDHVQEKSRRSARWHDSSSSQIIQATARWGYIAKRRLERRRSRLRYVGEVVGIYI